MGHEREGQNVDFSVMRKRSDGYWEFCALPLMDLSTHGAEIDEMLARYGMVRVFEFTPPVRRAAT